jgi:hypothetical protein
VRETSEQFGGSDSPRARFFLKSFNVIAREKGWPPEELIELKKHKRIRFTLVLHLEPENK